MARAKDEAREQRISMEAVVDGWFERTRDGGVLLSRWQDQFPFKARCRFARPISVLRSRKRWKSSAWLRRRNATAKCLFGLARWRSELPSR